jgi:hypothetical protein
MITVRLPSSRRQVAPATTRTTVHTSETARAVSARAVTLGIICAVLLCAVTPYNDFKVGATYLAGNQFPIGALFVLLVLALGVNPLLRRFAPTRTFHRGELLTVWILILVASGLPSSGMMRYLIPHIAAPQYYSNDTNGWEGKVWGALPDWLKLSDKAAADAFYMGYPRGHEHVPWDAWAKPLFFWSIPALLFLVAQFCFAAILRRQWVENERFAFPLVQLPLVLAEDPPAGHLTNPLVRNGLFWIAFGATTALHTLNGMHQLYPALPEIRTAINLQEYLTTSPWNQIGQFQMNFYPLVVGITYLLPSEVAFSLWFFHLFYKGEVMLCAFYNWDMPPPLGASGKHQFHTLQVCGGALGLFCWTLWTARHHLRDVWEKATNGPRAAAIDDSRELFGYRKAVFGLLIAYTGIGLWLCAAGVPLLLTLTCLVVLTLALVVIAWLVTQAGTLYMGVSYGSIDAIGATLGTTPFAPAAWFMTYRFEWIFARDTRELMLPEVLNSAKVSEQGQIPLRPLFGAMLASIAIGLVVSCYSFLSLPYQEGGANLFRNSWTVQGPTNALRVTASAASVPYPFVPTNGLHLLGGFIGVLGLLILRARFGFGLHPIGFLGASASAGHMLWTSLLIGWLAKTILLRYAGMNGYKRFLPFFLGLIVGDVVNAVIWIALGYITDTGYITMPT